VLDLFALVMIEARAARRSSWNALPYQSIASAFAHRVDRALHVNAAS
jgi:hypothetical protein